MLRMTRLFSCRDFWIMNGSGGWVWKYYNEQDDDFDYNDDEVKRDWDFWRSGIKLAKKHEMRKTSGRSGLPECGDSGSLKNNRIIGDIGDNDDYGGIYLETLVMILMTQILLKNDDMTWVGLSLENTKQQKSGIFCFICFAIAARPALGKIMILMTMMITLLPPQHFVRRSQISFPKQRRCLPSAQRPWWWWRWWN